MSAYSGATIIWLNTNDDGRYKIESNVITQSNLVFSIDTGISASYAGSGSVLINLSNTGHVGSINNNPVYSYFDGAFSFNGSNQYFNFAESNLGVEAQDKTMMAWIYPIAPTGALTSLVDRDNGANGYGFWISSAGKLWFWPTSNRDVTDNGPYSAANNTWTHVAVTYNFTGKSVGFYYNGQLSSTLTHLGVELAPGIGSRVNLNIGCLRNATLTNFFRGYMGPVQLYNRTLTQSEIIRNFNATRTRFGV